MNKAVPAWGIGSRWGRLTSGVLFLATIWQASPSALAATLYKNDFANLDGLVADGAAVLQVGPAPGGKAGNALRISNAGAVGNSGVTLTPNVTLPNAATFLFRVYIASHTSFQAVYSYPPGEGLRFLDAGVLQGSCGEGYTATWQPATWYTVAIVVPAGGAQSLYVRRGVDAQITEADKIGGVCPGNSTRPLTHSYFFNYGGDLYVADYTVNEGVDFSVCGDDSSFETGLDGWSGGANDGVSWMSKGGLCEGGYHQASRTGSYPGHEPYQDPGRATLTANLAGRFGRVIEYSYSVKDFSATTPGAGPVVHVFIDPSHGTPFTQWQQQLLPSYPTEWTKVGFVIDTGWTDAQAAAAGWTRTLGSGAWSAVFATSGVSGTNTGMRAIFGTSVGSFAGSRVTGVDGVSVRAGQLPQPIGTYGVPLTITSALPCPKVPMNPSIDFGQLIQQAGIEGVLDQNSIQVRDLATGEDVSRAVERFGSEDTLNVEWVVDNPAHTRYEIRFTTTSQRPPLMPPAYTPMIGVGDLLHYNAGEPRPVSPIFISGLYDVTGDGKPDLVGMWNYGHRPGDRWDGVIVYPRVGGLDEFKFGDMFRVYEVPDVRYSYANMADLDKDGRLDIIFAPSSTTQMTLYRDTGGRHANQLPVYAAMGSVNRPGGTDTLISAVDLDKDGVLDLVVGAGFPNAETGATASTVFLKNANPNGWPLDLQNAGTLNVAGVVPAFFDVDGDGRLDVVSLIVDPGDPGLSGFQVAWQRNLGSSPPSFGSPQPLAEINSSVWRPIHLAAVNDGPQRGLLVGDRNWQRVQFFERLAQPQGAAYFRLFGTAQSVSANVQLSDQASPYITDWDGDGDWDVLVGGGYGWPQILRNQGTSARPAFAEAELIEADGTPIRLLRNSILGQPYLWHNMGYPWPIHADWDLDGLPDLVVPNETNRIFWYKNIGTRQNPRFGPQQQVLVAGYPDSPALRQLSAQRALTAVYPNEVEEPFFWRQRASVVDMNGDGLPDLVAPDGEHANLAFYARYRDDQGGLGLRKWRDDPRLRTVSGATIGGQAFCVDWDGDGLIDIIQSRGGDQYSGSIFLLKNMGTRTDPLFADPQPLYCFGQPIFLTWHGPHPAVADLDGDQKPDLLCYTEWSVYACYSHVAIDMPRAPTYALGIPYALSVPADFDLDGDVDLEDFGRLQLCLTGAYLGPPAMGCEMVDLDGDGDVDTEDLDMFVRCVSGAGIPADVHCVR